MDSREAPPPDEKTVDGSIAGLELAMANRTIDMVESGIAERDARIRELEEVAEALSDEVVSRDRRIAELETELTEVRERNASIYESLADAAEDLEVLRADARGQATRIRMQALRHAARLDSQTSADAEFEARLERAAKAFDVAPLGEAAAWQAGDGEQANASAEPVLADGQVQLDIGPLADFSQLLELEKTLGEIEGAGATRVLRFSRGRAIFGIEEASAEAVRSALETTLAFDLEFRSERSGELVIDLVAEPGEGSGKKSSTDAA